MLKTELSKIQCMEPPSGGRNNNNKKMLDMYIVSFLLWLALCIGNIVRKHNHVNKVYFKFKKGDENKIISYVIPFCNLYSSLYMEAYV